MKKIIGILFLATILLGGCQQKSKKDSRPNIIIIVADDMGAWTLSINNDPNTYTPELDKLGNAGAVFSNCFANGAVCSPSRASLLTGRYPGETGITDYIREGDTIGVDLSLKMFPGILHDSGYSTILVGKWHLGEPAAYLPTQRGYDRFTGFPHGGMQSMSPRILVEGKWQTAEGAYTPDLLTDYAINYMNEFNPEKTGKPFLLSLHFWAPHANTMFPEGMKPSYKGRSWLPMQEVDKKRWNDAEIELPEPGFPNLDIPLTERMAREYYSSVHSVDRNVGRLMDMLDELHLSKNTIVVFTSDHGYMLGHHGLWHKGSGRWLTKDGLDPAGVYGDLRPNLYDNSLKVPCIIRWPGVVDAHSKIDETISFVDFFPTILKMAGITIPESILLRGRDFTPILKKETPEWNNNIYAEYIDLRTFRTPEWKIVLDFSGKHLNEFYDLKNDSKEQHNLFDSDNAVIRSKREELKRKLINKMRVINDPLLLKNQNSKELN